MNIRRYGTLDVLVASRRPGMEQDRDLRARIRSIVDTAEPPAVSSELYDMWFYQSVHAIPGAMMSHDLTLAAVAVLREGGVRVLETRAPNHYYIR